MRPAAAALLALLVATPVRSQDLDRGKSEGLRERVATGQDTLNGPAAPVVLTQEQEKLAAEIEETLKCPVCRSQSVRTSRSFMAEDMSRRIRQMVAAGRSKEEIRDYFVARYGDYILLAPRKQGFTWTVWLLPFALVLGGAVGIVVVARRWKGRAPPPRPAPESSSTSNYMQRLERELEETR